MEAIATNAGGIKVTLLGHTSIKPMEMISHAAHTCYQEKTPEVGPVMDVKKRLFDVGHHTTLQHWYATFALDGMSVGDVTFGLHLANPFYNSDQRSGRFCSVMFSNPKYEIIEKYIRSYWPEVSDSKVCEIMNYVKFAICCYQDNLDSAQALSKKYLAGERKNISEKTLNANFAKIAQEQMRMFIPVIFPTGMDYTINLSSLVASWESAWNPSMRTITDMMRDLVLGVDPRISFMFDEECRRKDDWNPSVKSCDGWLEKPEYILKNIVLGNRTQIPNWDDMHPVDRLHFKPELMCNSDSFIKERICCSVATMGQDQRHRTIRRTMPSFTGRAYLPPLLAEMKLGPKLVEVMNLWEKVSLGLPGTLAATLAPYGAMVTYIKTGDINAIAHEMGKRNCFCAQEEIYHLGIKRREKVIEHYFSLGQIFDPPCIKCGACAEGDRYCGRDMANLGFPERRV